MRLATLRRAGTTIAVRIDGDSFVAIPGFADVRDLLQRADWRAIAEAVDDAPFPLASLRGDDWGPVVKPGKIICVGLNYGGHILEMGRDLPAVPTLFAKFPEAIVGPYDDIRIPAAAPDMLDWEAELAVVIGPDGGVAGYTLINDVTARDYQYRTTQWLQGKTFASTAPLGPMLVTADEHVDGAELRCSVGGELVQRDSTADLVFGPAALVEYISAIIPLGAGDVIATGTPAGVGHAQTPARYLRPGDELVTEAEGIGVMRNRVVAS